MKKTLTTLALCVLATAYTAAYDVAYSYQGTTLYYNVYSDHAEVVPQNSTVKTNSNALFYYDEYLTGIVIIPENIVIEGEVVYYDANKNAYSGESYKYMEREGVIYDYESSYYDAEYGFVAVYYNASYDERIEIVSMSSEQVSLPVTVIGKNAFQGCDLQQVILPRTLQEIGAYAFAYQNAPYGNTYSDYSFKAVTIPEGVQSIDATAFSSCSKLEIVTWLAHRCNIVKSTTSNILFGKYSKVNTLIFGNEVTYVPANILECNTNVSSLALPHSVTEIGERAFAGCTQLYRIAIGSGIQRIGEYAFIGCHNLSTIMIYATVPPETPAYTFIDVPLDADVSVPCGYIDVYANAPEWENFLAFDEITTCTARVASADETQGIAYVEQTCAEATYSAEPLDGFVFVRWSDGNSENPRVVPLSSDVSLTAEFAPISTDIEFVADGAISISTRDGFVDVANAGDYHIFTITGLDVTLQNGNLPSGIYIIKGVNFTEKVMMK